jgi:kynurenine 3-monooxygenase
MASSKPILIVGAGLAGCLIAIEVARLGYRVVVVEKRQIDEECTSSGRSINLALAPSTLYLLHDAAGLGTDLKKIAIPLEGRVLHPVDGRALFQPYAESSARSSLLNPPAGAVSVLRPELNALLRRVAAQSSNVEVRFGQRVMACHAERAEVKTQDSQKKIYRESAEIIIAADGARSAIRRLMKREVREVRTTLKHAYKELIFQSSRNLRRPALHIWPRRGFLMMALPNHDRTFRGAIFLPQNGPNGFTSLGTAAVARQFFEKHFPDVMSNVEDLARQFMKNPISHLVSVRCDPWHIGRTLLIGDACHTLYPFTGQGANLALEDCVQLRKCMEQFAPDWPRVFSAFTENRKPKVDYLCEATKALSALVLNAMPEEGIWGSL